MAKKSFPKSARLRKGEEFRRCIRYGRHLNGALLSLSYRSRSKRTPPRLGITVSRRYGKAVDRNRMKRQMRELFRTHRPLLPPGYDLLIRPLVGVKASAIPDLALLRKELLTLLDALPPPRLNPYKKKTQSEIGHK